MNHVTSPENSYAVTCLNDLEANYVNIFEVNLPAVEQYSGKAYSELHSAISWKRYLMPTIYKTEEEVPRAFTYRGETRAQGTNAIRNWRGGSVIGVKFHRLKGRATYDGVSTIRLIKNVFWMMGVFSP